MDLFQEQALLINLVEYIQEVKVPSRQSMKITTNSFGFIGSSSDSSSSDHEDMPIESLSQLTSSLKLAQSRASSLSTNYARLMRLVRDDELEMLNKQIAQVRNGSYEPLREKYKEALEECERKKQIAEARLVAAETEIDVRFAAMVECEWSQFNVLHIPSRC
jgi:hypothetical protein